MTVEVWGTAKLVSGQRSVRARGSTVRELVDDLDSRYPRFKGMLVTNGQIHRSVNVHLNDEDIRFLGQLDTSLGEGDILSILPALAGGQVNFAPESCAFCGGGGWVRDHCPKQCPVCGGQGAVLVAQPSRRCGSCKGSGFKWSRSSYYQNERPGRIPYGPGFLRCPVCKGAGWALAYAAGE